ncbi:adenylosuccinate lyase [Halothermothrix orenii]|uniref:Adenylosuccinate lyase n=1 Tax=Halothermothrix orenii (strain H 168 / OCM 544 / DSM 9562) TaxID=373903 RepID=B8D0M6_HALOH|nr:adenylosuccinate lyase [Halothermothrix orenii H 168]
MERNIFENICPLDHRYSLKKDLFNDLGKYFSEKATIYFQARVELALVKALAGRGVCSFDVVKEVEEAVKGIKVGEVYEEEARTRHNIRALVNCIRKKISAEARPFVHLSATSFDIVDTANSLRYKEATEKLIVPALERLLEQWLNLAEQERDTLQIGRTHGQHAEPLTFGLVMAYYASRLHERIVNLEKVVSSLCGKMAGAVGAYNASSLFFEDPEEFEKEVLKELGLKPAPVSTQIVPPEYMTDYVHSLITVFGVLADFSDDMRHLQRTEIGETGEYFAKDQVGSSTMPHKRNPINYENVKSMWKTFMPRMVTMYLDQLSEHQRDLTNSASGRFIAEIASGLMMTVDRLYKVSSRMKINSRKMKNNFNLSKNMIIAEPLYIFLAAAGHPDAHEYVRKLTLKADKEGKDLVELIKADKEIETYLAKLDKRQKDILYNPEQYTGIARERTEEIVTKIRKERGL